MLKLFPRKFFSVLVCLQVLAVPHHTYAAPYLTPKAESALDSLSRSSEGTLTFVWNEQTGTPFRIYGKLSGPSRHSAQWITYAFLSRARALYSLANPAKDMRVEQVRSLDNGSATRVYVQRYLFGVPVMGDQLVLDIDRYGVIYRVEGTIHPDLEKKKFHRPMHPVVTESEAVNTAMQSIAADDAVQEHQSTLLYYLPSRPGIPLVYMVTIRSSENPGVSRNIFVHAGMGHVIK